MNFEKLKERIGDGYVGGEEGREKKNLPNLMKDAAEGNKEKKRNIEKSRVVDFLFKLLTLPHGFISLVFDFLICLAK